MAANDLMDRPRDESARSDGESFSIRKKDVEDAAPRRERGSGIAPPPVWAGEREQKRNQGENPPHAPALSVDSMEIGPRQPKKVGVVPPLRSTDRPKSPGDQPVAKSKPDAPQTPWGRVVGWIDYLTREESVSGEISLLVHLAFILLLAFLFFDLPKNLEPPSLKSGFTGERETFEFDPFAPDTPIDFNQTQASGAFSPSEWMDIDFEPTPPMQETGRPTDPRDMIARIDQPRGGSPVNRTEPGRESFVDEGGPGNPTAQTEEAVERGLGWLAAHQLSDGSWRFDLKHELGTCQGQCRNGGAASSSFAATGLALLAFLGAGYTHLEGPYQNVVYDGLYYMQTEARNTALGADLQEGNMYGQGIATLALCEAYTMTKDRNFEPLAQQAIEYIENSQHSGGGWRYHPGQEGDATVTGWQLMALRSAKYHAMLEVDQSVIYRADNFFNHLESDGGALYGYQDNEPKPTSTAIGLLCRMYSGRTPRRPEIARGLSHIESWGPDASDIYYDYYATLTLHHAGGSEFKRWYPVLSDHLLATQARQGHETGSWHFDDQYGNKGGRLYTTAMAVMILETPYRYLPLYQDESL